MAEPATSLPIRQGNENTPQSRRDIRPVENLQQAVNRVFDDFGRGVFGTLFLHRPFFDLAPFGEFGAMPASDVAERDDEYEITMELPGMESGDIDVKLSNNILTITGEKKIEKEEKKKDYFLSERHFGSFQRSFQLPDGVDGSAIAADFSQGVLTVSLPKSAAARAPEKKIDVKAA